MAEGRAEGCCRRAGDRRNWDADVWMLMWMGAGAGSGSRGRGVGVQKGQGCGVLGKLMVARARGKCAPREEEE